MYFAQPPNIWFDYKSNIGKIRKIPIRLWKSLVKDTPSPRITWGCGDLFVPHVRYTVGSKCVSREKAGCGTFGVDQRSLWQKLE